MNVKNDKKLWISVGAHCFANEWNNRQITWSKLLERISVPIRTPERYADYLKMTRAKQNKTKDHGGFVGGSLTGGRRGRKTVKSRSILAFDMDHADPDFWEQFKLLAGCAAALYSTHKHSPDKPRLRVLVPLSRDVTPDEYEAVARMFASDFEMLEQLDPKTFEPERLMYWPTCSDDAEFLFDYIDAPFLDPDTILKEYPDWTDVSLWPTVPGEAKAHRAAAEKQQDPTAKPGMIGAFCRIYDVPAAIDAFLPDVYTPTAKEDRYTYAAGSTAAGLVIYEDGRFAFSNHGTDPAGGQLCNAFDLVRIHKFGSLDDDAKENTPANKLPSFRAMQELVSQDSAVLKELDRERMDFDDSEEDDEDWLHNQKIIKRDKNGLIAKTIVNAEQIFAHDPGLQGLAYNSFSGFIEVHGTPVPWPHSGAGWRDADDSQLVTYLAKTYGVEFPRQVIMDQKVIAAERHAFHPIREYLQGLSWDGVARCDTLLIDYLGAADDIYTREATSRILLAAVHRVFEPGCKFDTMLVLAGLPNTGKSMLIAKLGGRWFSDNLTFEDMRDKTGAEKLPNYWLLEISEMKGLKKTDVESSKAFISRQEDIYRAAYGRNTERHPRQCVFFGTVNDVAGYLKDITGNRRFWPIEITGEGVRKPWELTQEEVDQIWAEMYFRYTTLGERNLLLSPEAQKIAELKQTEAMEVDDREGVVNEYLNTLLPEGWDSMSISERKDYLSGDGFAPEIPGTIKRESVISLEIWCECFNRSEGSIQKKDSYEIAGILKRLGWVKSGRMKRFPWYGMARYYVRKQ